MPMTDAERQSLIRFGQQLIPSEPDDEPEAPIADPVLDELRSIRFWIAACVDEYECERQGFLASTFRRFGEHINGRIQRRMKEIV